MVSLVNAARKAIGKGGVGWLNPALYRNASSYVMDIVSGNNKCTQAGCCSTGFTTAKGWDAATGIGSINFRNFTRVFQSLGNKLNISTESVASTSMPSTPPTSMPSTPPTSMPSTSNTGWMYKYTYQQSSCAGQVISVHAVPLGVCLRRYQLIGSVFSILGYEMFSCNGGKCD